MEDLVSRQAVINSIANTNFWLSSDNWNEIMKAINAIPSVNPQEPKTGHWIEKEDFDGDIYYDCSECGESFTMIDGTPTDNLYNFCPNCGKKMNGGKG